MLWVRHESPWKPAARNQRLLAVRLLLEEQREDGLALLDERDRTIVLVLAFCGFRVSSVVTLMRDCLELGSDGQPYLRYFNVKGSREAMLPIPPLLAEQLGRQRAWLAERLPDTRVAVSLTVAPGDEARRVSYQPQHG